MSRYVEAIVCLKSQSDKVSVSECICNPHGSTTLECGKNNGVCSCKEGFAGIKCHECMPNVVGDKCDVCKPSFFDFPTCQEGLSKLTMHVFWKVQTIILFQTVNVILMLQLI